ncbi:hypothetical protein [Cellulomonas flavigena]|uniref:hypothetical protein n=1 Tax=Cellulomonas flavigena TaxID=1711 RepID=UPI00019E4528|nr:hypothetical protein [Cellulomonas flavigena]
MLISSVDRLGADAVSDLVRLVVSSLRPQWITIDAYGRPDDQVEDVRRQLASLAQGTDPSGIRISADDEAAVELLARYAPWSADVEIGADRAGEPVLEIVDGDTVSIVMNASAEFLVGGLLDLTQWDVVPARPPLVRRVWSRLAGRKSR